MEVAEVNRAQASSATGRCPRCGAQIPIGAPAGLCPQCELQGALDVWTNPSSDESADDAVETPEALAAPLRQFADYELLEEIARGGMGVVYRARQRSLDRIVAVKMLLSGPLASREFIQRFRTEAAAVASLQHPNIVAIHEVGFHLGQHFFAMDFVAGRTLADIISGQALPAKRAASYLKTAAEAVHYAHEHGILHRDLKPSNVIIDADDQPRITDFGLAKRVSADLPGGGYAMAAFSPDSRFVVLSSATPGSSDGLHRLHRVGSWELMREFPMQNIVWAAAAFSPDGRLLALRASGSGLRLLDTRDFSELATFDVPEQQMICEPAFSPGGTRLGVTCESRLVQVWDLRAVRQSLARLGLDWDQPPYPPAPAESSVVPRLVVKR